MSIKKFRQFMRQEGCWDKFKKNMSWFTRLKDLEEQRERDELVCAFNWTTSPEGFDYWYNISLKWEKLDEEI